MAIPSRQIGWGTEENLLWEISKQLEAITGVAYNSGGGAAGTSGTSGASFGTSGTSGLAGTAGTSGSSGTTGVSGTSGGNGTAGTSGTSPVVPSTINYGLFSQTSSGTVITNTVTETSLIGSGVGTLSVPANGFSVGDSFNVNMIGHISCNASATLRIRVKTGSIILGDTGVIALDATTDQHWRIAIDFTIRQIGAATTAAIVTGGLFSYVKNSGTNIEGYNFVTLNNTTFDTTVSNTLDITAQWGAATTADIIYSDVFILNKIY